MPHNHCSEHISPDSCTAIVQILDQIRPEKTAPTTALWSNTAGGTAEENIDLDGVGGHEDEAASCS